MEDKEGSNCAVTKNGGFLIKNTDTDSFSARPRLIFALHTPFPASRGGIKGLSRLSTTEYERSYGTY